MKHIFLTVVSSTFRIPDLSSWSMYTAFCWGIQFSGQKWGNPASRKENIGNPYSETLFVYYLFVLLFVFIGSWGYCRCFCFEWTASVMCRVWGGLWGCFWEGCSAVLRRLFARLLNRSQKKQIKTYRLKLFLSISVLELSSGIFPHCYPFFLANTCKTL